MMRKNKMIGNLSETEMSDSKISRYYPQPLVKEFDNTADI